MFFTFAGQVVWQAKMFDNNLEGFNICQRMWYTFWNPSMECFTTQNRCHESHGNQFSCYAQAVAMHAIADSLRVYKDLTMPIVEPAIKSCLKYRSQKRGAYSVDFKRNEINSGDDHDICYDDNAHLLRAYIEIYETTKNPKHLGLCKEVMNFLLSGIVEHQKWKIKGLKWHMEKKYMATISNCIAAICAMKMIPYASDKKEEQQLYNFALICVNFIWEKLRDPKDDVIMDGIGYDSDVIDVHKWTYNQGGTLSAVCLLYKYDHDPKWLDMANRLADGGSNPGKTLFDRDYKGNEKRFWHDTSYFAQLLAEGLVEYVETFQNEGPKELVENCKFQVARHLSYFRKYCFDPNDGLYYMNFDIFRINWDVYQRFRNEFGGTKDYQPDPRERSKGMDGTPVDKRPMAKSLIGAGAAAHMFFSGGRIMPDMQPVSI